MDGFERRLETVDAALRVFEDELTVERPADFISLAARRTTLSRAVSDFLMNEWRTIDALGQTDGGHGDAVKALYRAFVGLRARYSMHIARWNSATIAADWQAYREDSLALIRGMKALLAARTTAARRAA